MASPEDYAAWIVKNADKKGSSEFDTVSRAYQESRRFADLKQTGAVENRSPVPQFVPSGESHPAGSPALAKLGYDPSSLGITPAENIAGHPITRVATGNPLVGLLRTGATVAGPNALSEQMGRSAEMEQTGREALGSKGFDWTKASGGMIFPWGKFAPKEGIVAKTAYGTGEGIIGGAASGGETGTDVATHTTIGGALGASIPVAGGVLRSLGRASNLITPGGGKRIADQYVRDIAGNEQRAPLIEALEAARNRVPGSEPMSNQVVAHLPEGSPIVAAQKITAAIPGGISSEFGKRIVKQQEARLASLQSLGTSNNVTRQTVTQALERKLMDPITNQETPTKFLKALEDDSDFVKSVTGIRKNLDQVYTPPMLTKLKAIAEELSANVAVSRPVQKTNLQGGVDIAEQTRTHAPQLLSRPMMIANYILGGGAKAVTPAVDKAMAESFLNPQVLATALKDVPPNTMQKIIEAVVKQVGASGPGRLSVGPAAMAVQQENP